MRMYCPECGGTWIALILSTPECEEFLCRECGNIWTEYYE